MEKHTLGKLLEQPDKSSGRRFGSHVRRMFAFLIDIVPIITAVYLIAYHFFGFNTIIGEYYRDSHDPEARQAFLVYRNIIFLIAFGGWIVYGMVMDATRMQGTVGKYLLNLKVTSYRGTRISFVTALIRNAAKLISVLPFGAGLIWSLFDKNQRTFHDRLSKSVVEQTESISLSEAFNEAVNNAHVPDVRVIVEPVLHNKFINRLISRFRSRLSNH